MVDRDHVTSAIPPSNCAGDVYDKSREISTKVVELHLPSPGAGEVLSLGAIYHKEWLEDFCSSPK